MKVLTRSCSIGTRSHDKLSIHPCSKKDVVDDKLPNEVRTTPHFQ